MDLRKARECELATLDEKSTSRGIEGKSRGEEGTPLCPRLVQKKLESIDYMSEKINKYGVNKWSHGADSNVPVLAEIRGGGYSYNR